MYSVGVLFLSSSISGQVGWGAMTFWRAGYPWAPATVLVASYLTLMTVL